MNNKDQEENIVNNEQEELSPLDNILMDMLAKNKSVSFRSLNATLKFTKE
jgi:hypothetical protein